MIFINKYVIKNVVLCFLFMPFMATANVIVHGKATISYESELFSSKPSAEFRQRAIEKAKIAAWNKYTQDFSPAKMKNYRRIESNILSHINEYIIESNVISEKVDEHSNRYTLIVRTSINTTKFDAKMSEASASGAQRSGSGGLFSFIFVARQESSVKSYDAKQTRIEQEVGRGFEKESAAQQGDSVMGSHDYKNIKKTTSGGSTVHKSDSIEYRILSSDDVDTSMNQVLSSAGFEVVDYGDVVSECGGTEPSEIKHEFTKSHSVSRMARRNAIKGSRECEVSYFAIGTLDVGLAQIDPVTGNQRVYVTVKAQVWNIDKRLPRKIASVGPIQYQGLGPNARVAQTNALNQAAKNTAKELVSQLNAKGLR